MKCVLGNLHSLQASDRCIPILKQAVASGSLCGHVLLGLEYHAKQEFQEAIEVYQKALLIDPKEYKAW